MAYKKPKDYDSVKVGESRILPAGGYICRILKAEETESRAGKPMIKVAFDIEGGEYAGYFRDQFENKKAMAEDPSGVSWPFSGTKWILLFDNEGATNRDFKSFCTALEDSGTEVWKDGMIDAARLKNAKLGIIFRREEHDYMGTFWRTVPWGFRSVKTIEEGNYNVPEDKPLAKKVGSYEVTDSFSAAEDDIPF